MLLERMTFQAKYGKGDALVELFREQARTWGPKMGFVSPRILTDHTGSMFTVIVEQEFKDLDDYSRRDKEAKVAFATPEFANWFARMEQVVERGERQLFNVEALK